MNKVVLIGAGIGFVVALVFEKIFNITSPVGCLFSGMLFSAISIVICFWIRYIWSLRRNK